MIGRAGELRHRRHACMRDQALEALRLRADPVGHVAAEAAAHRHDAVRINVGARSDRVGHRHQILVALVAPHVAPDALHERLAKAGRAARIRLRDCIALRHRQQRIPAPMPPIGGHADRAAVDPQQCRQAALRIFRLDHEVLHVDAVGRLRQCGFRLRPSRDSRSRIAARASAAGSRVSA